MTTQHGKQYRAQATKIDRTQRYTPEEATQLVKDTSFTKFDATVVMDIMRTHPMVIIGGILQENPFYAPPDEFIRELHERQ